MNQAMLFPLLASLLAFASVLLLGLGVVGARREAGRALRLRGKVAGFAGLNAAGAPVESVLVRLGRALAEVVRSLGARLGPKDQDNLDQTRLDLIRAGLRGPGAVQAFHGAKAAFMLLPPSLFLAVVWVLPQALSLQLTVIGALTLACLGTLARAAGCAAAWPSAGWRCSASCPTRWTCWWSAWSRAWAWTRPSTG